jgi:Protein of unknown function (DUF3089)
MGSSRRACRTGSLTILLMLGLARWCLGQDAAAHPYAAPETWLCRPGRQDLCAVVVGRATIAPDGSVARDESIPNRSAPVDCFYVYPTISQDPNGNSPLVAGPGERRAVERQFAMFSSVCRTFAPVYRQITLAGLRSLMTGQPIPMDPELAYRDVAAAWKHYLRFDNGGRGVVLIGHSQGSRMLIQLIQREIEGTASQPLLVSAVLAGMNVEVPAGQDRGGSFKSIPLCKSASQTGCVIAYVSFRSSSPPPANARFGRTRTPGMDVACVDPVALSGTQVRSFLPVQDNLLGVRPTQADWLAMASAIDAPFVSLPGLLSARCVSEGGASYLSLSMAPNSNAKRPNDVPGDVASNGRILDDWGLHLLDINLVAGNLQELIRRQATAYLSNGKGAPR